MQYFTAGTMSNLHPGYRAVFLAAVCICFVFITVSWALAGTVRKPIAAGTFYPDDPGRLKQMTADLTLKAEKNQPDIPADRPLKAMVMPHAGYVYSGLTAAHAAAALEGQKFSKIIILAPDHRTGFHGCAISDADSYQTPLGRILIHPDADNLREQYGFFRAVFASDASEHAVEVILPFLQTWLTDFKIIPIVIGRGDNSEAWVSALEKILDTDTLVIVSTDLSHYLPYEKAVAQDKQTIKYIENLNAKAIAKDSNRACGIKPLLGLIELAKSRNWEGRLLDYSNSGDTAGKNNKVVGYATMAFYGEKEMNKQETEKQINSKKGEVLLELARKSIADRLGVSWEPSPEFDSRAKDPVFESRRGTFVTLKINDQLRGCIGNLVPEKPLIQGVKDNAVNAAFNDPRFAPLSKEEFARIQIEVSLLTEPMPLEYRDAQELLEKIRPDVDGLIISKGPYSATFLPQVWEQLPDKKSFLSNLCMKAGLPADEWKKGNLQVYTYQVQYFEESA